MIWVMVNNSVPAGIQCTPTKRRYTLTVKFYSFIANEICILTLMISSRTSNTSDEFALVLFILQNGRVIGYTSMTVVLRTHQRFLGRGTVRNTVSRFTAIHTPRGLGPSFQTFFMENSSAIRCKFTQHFRQY